MPSEIIDPSPHQGVPPCLRAYLGDRLAPESENVGRMLVNFPLDDFHGGFIQWHRVRSPVPAFLGRDDSVKQIEVDLRPLQLTHVRLAQPVLSKQPRNAPDRILARPRGYVSIRASAPPARPGH